MHAESGAGLPPRVGHRANQLRVAVGHCEHDLDESIPRRHGARHRIRQTSSIGSDREVNRTLGKLCYPGRTMPVAKRTANRPTRRAGRTEKVSISLNRADVSLLQKRARRLYGGNLSAVIADGVQRVREEEGREALVAWLGAAGHLTAEQRESIRAEWRGAPTRPRRRR